MNHFRYRLFKDPAVTGPAKPWLRADGFTLVELLVVLVIIGIIAAIASPLVPALLRGNQVDASVNTLAGILEEARESATASNTYIWVAFSDPLTTAPQRGTWVAILQSLDGTETISSSVTTTPFGPPPTAAPAMTIPSTTTYSNIALHSAVVNLPGVQVISGIVPAAPTPSLANINSNISTSATAKTPPGPVPPTSYASLLDSLNWTVTTLQNTGVSVTFTHAIEFTPNGEAHVPTWNSNIQFGLVPTVGPKTNVVLYNITRLTGKATVFRM